MDILNLGDVGRRTHIRPKENLAKDEYGMEDLEDFFKETTGIYGSDADSSENESVHQKKRSSSPRKTLGAKRRNNVPRKTPLISSKLSMIPLEYSSKLAIEEEQNLSMRSLLITKKSDFSISTDHLVVESSLRSASVSTVSGDTQIDDFEGAPQYDEDEPAYDESDANPELPGSPIPIDPSALFSTSADALVSSHLDHGLQTPSADQSMVESPLGETFEAQVEDESEDERENSDSNADAPKDQASIASGKDQSDVSNAEESEYANLPSFSNDMPDLDDDIPPESQSPKGSGFSSDDSYGDQSFNPTQLQLQLQDTASQMTSTQDETSQESVKRPAGRGRPKKSQSISEVILHPSLPSPPPEGLRRSNRKRIKPLAYWRNERVIYARTNEGDVDPDSTLVMDVNNIPLREIQEVITFPEQIKSKRPKKKKHPGLKDSLEVSRKNVTNLDDLFVEPDSKQDGTKWYEQKVLRVSVFDSEESLVEKLVACSPQGIEFKEENSSKDGFYKFGTIFHEAGEVMAAAYLDLPVDGVKNLHSSQNSLFYFNVIVGEVEVQLNEDKFTVLAGTTFKVPHNNTYAIKNTTDMPARLFVVQCNAAEDKQV
ncbi:hypothetical protein PUMCH_001318 [Australozyma saopauloensis]|uniref:Mif2/CENP-C cupin domain-containing protein n=1 Tax=Australozyma saopauloensis TaxID=291208 RepID=A0AAX4H646_9ASCO|nr:hypothetical protein PUMCH_001318 [[Candida] saopauloensis]